MPETISPNDPHAAAAASYILDLAFLRFCPSKPNFRSDPTEVSSKSLNSSRFNSIQFNSMQYESILL